MQVTARHSALAAALLAALCAASTAAHAGGITISPVVVEIDNPRKAAAVTVTNGTGAPLSLQADARLWQQENGKDSYEATQDLLVVPPIATLPPNGTQVFRVALRKGSPAPVERTFRLVLEDVSQAQPGSDGLGVAFRYTHNLPVMVAPTGGTRMAVQFSPCESRSEAGACVRVVNTGNKRVKVQTLAIQGEGWQQTLQLEHAQNILAGASREWQVPLQAAALPAVRSVDVQTAQGATLKAGSAGTVQAQAGTR